MKATIIETITHRVICRFCIARGPRALTLAGAKRAARKAGWRLGRVEGVMCPSCNARLDALIEKQKGD